MSKVIILNGCSSSGKTTVAQKLQQVLPEPFQHIALDQFRDGMPMAMRGLNAPAGSRGADGINVVPVSKNGEQMTEIRFGDHGERVLAAMRRCVAVFAQAGLNVIVDDLLFEPSYLDDYASVLDSTSTWLIGVHCSRAEVMRREEGRLGRFPGTATAHFETVHEHGYVYDLNVNTDTAPPREVAQLIAHRIQAPPQAFKAMLS